MWYPQGVAPSFGNESPPVAITSESAVRSPCEVRIRQPPSGNRSTPSTLQFTVIRTPASPHSCSSICRICFEL
jgi:hypothetical protein